MTVDENLMCSFQVRMDRWASWLLSLVGLLAWIRGVVCCYDFHWRSVDRTELRMLELLARVAD